MKPASRQSAFFWQGSPSVIGATLPAPKADAKVIRYSAPIEGREAGQRATDKRDAARRSKI